MSNLPTIILTIKGTIFVVRAIMFVKSHQPDCIAMEITFYSIDLEGNGIQQIANIFSAIIKVFHILPSII